MKTKDKFHWDGLAAIIVLLALFFIVGQMEGCVK
jgi:hypothetical protein